MKCKRIQYPLSGNLKGEKTPLFAISNKETSETKRLPTLKRPIPSRGVSRSRVKQAQAIRNHITLSETKPDSPLKHEPDTYNNSWNSELNVPQITTLSAPIQVLINRRADMFKGFYFLDQDFSIGPYSLVKMVKPQWYNIEVGLSTSYNTVFPESVLKKYASTGYSQNPPQNAYMLKSFAKQNLISSIVGWSPQEKLIAITFKCCHPLHCVVFDLVEAALAVESVSSALFRHLATEFNDAWERLEKLKQ